MKIKKYEDQKICRSLIDNNITDYSTFQSIYIKYRDHKELLRKQGVVLNDYFKGNDSDDQTSHFLQKQFEAFKDDVENTIINNKARKLLKSVVSNKYSHLVNDETFNIVRQLSILGVERKELQNSLTKKIAQFDNVHEFNDSLNNYLALKSNWSFESVVEDVKATVSNDFIYQHADNQIVFNACDFKVSQQFGSAMWCVTRDVDDFKGYTIDQGMDRLVFIYDFNKNPSDNESLKALLVGPQGYVYSGFYKDDSEMKEEDLNAHSCMVNAMTKGEVFHFLDMAEDQREIEESIRDPNDIEMFNLFGDMVTHKDERYRYFNNVAYLLSNDFSDAFEMIMSNEDKKEFFNEEFNFFKMAEHCAEQGYVGSFNYLLDNLKNYNEETYQNIIRMSSYFANKSLIEDHPEFYNNVIERQDLINGLKFLNKDNDESDVLCLPEKILNCCQEEKDEQYYENLALKTIQTLGVKIESLELTQNSKMNNFVQKFFSDKNDEVNNVTPTCRQKKSVRP